MSRSSGAARWPELDGLRACSVLMISLFHLFDPALPSWNPLRPSGGFLGITVFFTLSGFLITFLLLSEHDRTGRIGLLAFYARRARRLLPALAVVLVVVGTAAAVERHQTWAHPTLISLPWVVFYLGNWFAALHPMAQPLGALGHTWSLAVEEQFYLLWPLALILLLRRGPRLRRVAVGLVGLAGAVMIWRWLAIAHLGYGIARVYYGTDFQADGLLVGSAVAFVLADRAGRPLGRTGQRLLDAGAAAAMVILAVLTLRLRPLADRSIYAGISAGTLCSGVIVANLVTRPLRPVGFVLRSRPFQWVGRRSYGIYLWQFPMMFLVAPAGTLGLSSYPYAAAVFCLTLVAAALSFRFVEAPLRRRTQDARPQVPVHPAGAGQG